MLNSVVRIMRLKAVIYQLNRDQDNPGRGNPAEATF
jgi:hypothetical protein